MSSQTIVPLADVERLQAEGIAYPKTIHGWRWLYRNRHQHGLAGAFLRVGRRVLVDVTRYLELVRQDGGARVVDATKPRERHPSGSKQEAVARRGRGKAA